MQHGVGCRAEGGGRGQGRGGGQLHWVICPWSCVVQMGCVMEEEEEEALVEQLLRSLVQKNPLGTVAGASAACTMLVQDRRCRAHFILPPGKI